MTTLTLAAAVAAAPRPRQATQATRWEHLADQYITAAPADRRAVWTRVDALAQHLLETDATYWFCQLVAAVKWGRRDAADEALTHLIDAAPLVSPALLARQFVRLADWQVQTQNPAALTAGHQLAGRALAPVFDVLCDVTERMAEIAGGQYEFAAHEDPDDVDRDAIEAHADALNPLVFAAATRALSGGAR